MLGRGLGLLLGMPDLRDTGNGSLSEVGSVAGLGDLAGDGLVGATEPNNSAMLSLTCAGAGAVCHMS